MSSPTPKTLSPNKSRRSLMLGVALSPLAGAGCAALSGTASAPRQPTLSELGIYSAGQGSAFLPYAQAVAAVLSESGLKSRALVTAGSIENLQKLNADPQNIGTAFLGTAFEALNASAPWTKGEKLQNLRALAPMYETSFQLVALRSAGVARLADCAGKRVGVGPKAGPAESFFLGLLELATVRATVVNGTPAELSAQLLAGKIDVLWQGASVPIPALTQVTENADAVVFGLNDDELAAMLKRYAFLSRASVPAGSYRGQTQALQSVSAWNFLVAHRDFPLADAYWLIEKLYASKELAARNPNARATQLVNAANNTFLPFHVGALAFARDHGGITLPR
jgi:uncharacterized protein